MEKTLITGAAGFIGQQLTKDAIAKGHFVIAVDVNESILLEMLQTYSSDHIAVMNISVTDKHQLDECFKKHHPDNVIHAAAHKHVSIVEMNPKEAINNNIIGTMNVFSCCVENDVKKCIYISTDKADEPTSVYGWTKKACEGLVSTYSKFNKTTFSAVRFCNVKGAPGSVIPRFERQIANNQAITVTDFRMERYFISVEKASDFVMRVLDIMQNDHIYMLDVGEATNIYELAKKMRDDAGKHDLEIIETGILPGERLTEPYVIGNQAHVVDDIYLVK